CESPSARRRATMRAASPRGLPSFRSRCGPRCNRPPRLSRMMITIRGIVGAPQRSTYGAPVGGQGAHHAVKLCRISAVPPPALPLGCREAGDKRGTKDVPATAKTKCRDRPRGDQLAHCSVTESELRRHILDGHELAWGGLLRHAADSSWPGSS